MTTAHGAPAIDQSIQPFAALAESVLHIEAEAITALTTRLDHQFALACTKLMQCQGRVVVTGMGKSGHIGNKIASTLASTGTPAFFVHPGEASHGDMGMITSKDVIIAISNSGESPEILQLIPVIKRLGTTLISMTGRAQSSLARQADINLDVSVAKEACPFNLAPTASTTATLAMGDAIAVALLKTRGFTANDFALYHPGGALGRRLLLQVRDIMHDGASIPTVAPNTMLADALMEITQKRLGMTTVVDAHGHLLGVFTDGDLRRALDTNRDIRQITIESVMSKSPITVSPDLMAVEAMHIMRDRQITTLIITEHHQRVMGVLHMHDLLKAGVV